MVIQMSNKDKITEAAKELFQKEGYAKTSLRDIASKAGVGVSSILYYFESKEALYEILFSDEPEEKKSGREKIEKAAMEMFALHGYDGVSIRDIAKKAGVNSASISYYFGSKSKLYEAIIQESNVVVEAFIKKVESSEIGPKKRLQMFEEFFEDLAQNHPEQMHIFFWEQMHPTDVFSDDVNNVCAQIVEIIKTAIQDGMRTGEFRKDVNPAEASIAWAGMVIYYFVVDDLRQRLHVETEISIKGYMQEAFRIFIRGIENNK